MKFLPIIRGSPEDELVAGPPYIPPSIIVPQTYTQSRVLKALDYSNIFQPASFDDYVGQNEAKYLAQIMVTAARNEARPLPNILVVGEYGLGKTSLARLIIQAYGGPERMYDGASINREIPAPGTIIVDEIHNITPETSDALHLDLDTGKFTIIGCTTNSGALSMAFRSRFRTLFLEDYSSEELSDILIKVCKRRSTTYEKGAIVSIAERSRFNARQAVMLLQTVFDFMSVKNQRTVTGGIVEETILRLGIDDRGFLPRDRKYINALPDRPVGLQYLSARLGIDEATIEHEVEPFLMRMGLIDRTPRGRVKLQDY